VRYAQSSWNKSLPSVKVFDLPFVNENVHSGDVIGPEHRQRLHRFAIGELGVKLSEKIECTVRDIEKITSSLSTFKDVIQPHLKGVPLDEFLILKPHPNLDSTIADQERTVSEVAQSSEIASKPELVLIELPDFSFDRVASVLAKDLKDIDQQAVDTVRSQLERHFPEGDGEVWIAQGMEHLKGECCPFCGQSITGLSLVEAYRHYFADAYSRLKADIEAQAIEVGTLLSLEAILPIQELLLGNSTRAAYWTEHVHAEYPELAFSGIRDSWARIRTILKSLFTTKSSSPIERVDADEQLGEARGEYRSLSRAIAAYNRSVELCNGAIAKKKAALATASLEEEKKRLVRLQATQRRYEQSVADACGEYLALGEKKKELLSKSESLRENLRKLNEQLLGEYGATMNSYLQKFGASFQLCGMKEEYIRGTPRIKYQIRLGGQDLPLAADSGPCFETALSGGDRSALALAFFLARLENAPDLANAIVVLDDPFCSLDYNRRHATQSIISDMAGKAEQVIVLCHEALFLRGLWEDHHPPSDVKTLGISEHAGGQIIAEWDIEEATGGQYYADYVSLTNYLDDPSPRDRSSVARRIRPLLEANLRFRFPRQFKKGEWLGDMLATIKAATEPSPLVKLQVDVAKLEDITDYASPFHHDQNPSASTVTTTQTELQTYIRRVLPLL